jgi:hypothetical protein
MKKATAGLVSVVFVLLGFLFMLTVEAQVGGSPKDRMTKPIGPTAPGDKGKPGQFEQQQERQPQRNAWLQGDERQQEQLVGCYRLSATLAQHSRDIRKIIIATDIQWKEVVAQFEDLNRGVAVLTEKQEQFALGLNNGQQAWWERPLQEIMALQLQLHEQMESIGRGLNSERPEKLPMVKAFTDLDNQFRKWNRAYGQIGADMKIEDLELAAPGKIRGLPGAQNPGR